MLKRILFYITIYFAIFNFSLNQDKICFICLHDEQSSYDKNFIDAANDICDEKGVQAEFKTNIPEGDECYEAAKEFANNGCKAVFADSFGHEEYILKAAKEFPNVEFGHATGTLAHTNKDLTNFHNAFASIYEGRYATGVAAGMKLNEMINNGEIKDSEAIVGYVGAFPYAEVISGYTAFYLGVKSICNSAKMKVRYTNSWYDENLEKEAAEKLIDIDGCKIISQHADSSGSPNVCESKGVPNVFYNGENPTLTKSYLISSRINWRPYFKYFIESTLNGDKMDPDWTGNLENGAVEVYPASSLAPSGTQNAVDKAISDLKSKNIKVFDTSKFTVNGETLTTYKADVDTDPNYEKDTEVISEGYFHESEYRSAPYFDIIIDGIEISDDNGNGNGDNDEPKTYNIPNRGKNKNKGLSGGTIVAIILPIVAIIAILVAVIMLLSKGSSEAATKTASIANSSIQNLNK